MGRYPKKPETLIQKNVSTPLFTAALFTITTLWKKPRCPSVEEWMQKLWSVHTMEYYSATKKKSLPFATAWMDPESIVLSEISQSEKDKYPTISLKRGVQRTK